MTAFPRHPRKSVAGIHPKKGKMNSQLQTSGMTAMGIDARCPPSGMMGANEFQMAFLHSQLDCGIVRVRLPKWDMID